MKTFIFIILISFSYSSFASLLPFEQGLIKIYENVAPSVISVTSHRLARDWNMETLEIPAGMGSGFIWDHKGHIVTNYHVVSESQRFKITFHNDPKEYLAKVVGVAPKKDIAVLKLQGKIPKHLKPINVGKSKGLKVGQFSIALGNPFGLKHSMSMGIISALERQIEGISGVKIYGMIQTDAAINKGNSGGPLVNSSGDLIGMNTIIYSTSGSSAGLGFAVPSDTISKIVPQLIQFGKIQRPGLGISLLPDHMKERLFQQKKGIIISEVQANSSAYEAGLRGIRRDRRGRLMMGDIILEIDNHKINSYDDIYNLFDHYKVGDKVRLKYQREGQEKTISMTLRPI